MTNEEAKKMLKAKLECLKNETSGINYDCNMRLCDGCSLNYEQGNMGEQKEALKTAIKALEQQPCEDCISREALLKNLEEPMNWTDSEAEIQEQRDYEGFIELVKSMPSVTPQPKSGEWIDKGYDIGNCWATCSECDGDARGYAKDTGWGHDYYFPKFCPHCGARMNGGGEE